MQAPRNILSMQVLVAQTPVESELHHSVASSLFYQRKVEDKYKIGIIMVRLC